MPEVVLFVDDRRGVIVALGTTPVTSTLVLPKLLLCPHLGQGPWYKQPWRVGKGQFSPLLVEGIRPHCLRIQPPAKESLQLGCVPGSKQVQSQASPYLIVLLKIEGFNFQSHLSGSFLDSSSAAWFCKPGMCSATRLIFLSMHHSHNFFASWVREAECVPPLLLT